MSWKVDCTSCKKSYVVEEISDPHKGILIKIKPCEECGSVWGLVIKHLRGKSGSKRKNS